jgi:hypothetical protein
MSWEFNTTPVEMEGFEPTSHIEIDSTTVSEAALKAIEDALYGTEAEEAYLPTPNQIIEMVGDAA